MSGEDHQASAGHIIGIIFRDLFIGGKCTLLVIKSSQVAFRYYSTYDTILQWEIWYLALSAIKILILIPNILIIVNINYLFTMFVLNSLMQIVSDYYIHTKALKAMYNTNHSVGFSLLLVLRLFLLFLIVMWAMYPVFGLSCAPEPYPP